MLICIPKLSRIKSGFIKTPKEKKRAKTRAKNNDNSFIKLNSKDNINIKNSE